jgi:hypothetical protein
MYVHCKINLESSAQISTFRNNKQNVSYHLLVENNAFFVKSVHCSYTLLKSYIVFKVQTK